MPKKDKREMKSGGKLGRNPLEKMQSFLEEPLEPAPFNAIHGSKKGEEKSALLKIKEMNITVDWKELYRSTLGQQVKRIGRFFSIS